MFKLVWMENTRKISMCHEKWEFQNPDIYSAQYMYFGVYETPGLLPYQL